MHYLLTLMSLLTIYAFADYNDDDDQAQEKAKMENLCAAGLATLQNLKTCKDAISCKTACEQIASDTAMQTLANRQAYLLMGYPLFTRCDASNHLHKPTYYALITEDIEHEYKAQCTSQSQAHDAEASATSSDKKSKHQRKRRKA